MPLYPAPLSGAQPLVQARRTTTFTLSGAFADIALDSTDVQNNINFVEQTSPTEITAKFNGQYEVTYGCTGPAAVQTTSLRVQKNHAGSIVGSEASATSDGDAENISRQFIVSLIVGDVITLQAMSSAGTPNIAAGLTLTITLLAGEKGDPGGGGATDVNAVHVNVADEIELIAEKLALDANDALILEDSMAGWIKKRVKAANLPSGAALAVLAPVNVTKAAADVGLGLTAARDNHKHDISTAAPGAGAVAVGNAAAEGAATTLARSNHQHAVARGNPVDVGTANNAGAGTDFAAGDHVHAGLTRGAGDFSTFAADIAPVGADVMLLEDSTAGGAKKSVQISNLLAGVVLTTRTLTAGAGLTGGGDLSANRTFNVAANADGSIVVNADDIQVGVLATDGQHGVRGGGTQHAVAVAGVSNGFMSSAMATTLASAVQNTRTIIAGAGLTGGGDLSANRTFDVVANADGSIVVNANDIQVGVINATQHGNLAGGALHAVASGAAAGFMSAANFTTLATLTNVTTVQADVGTTTNSATFVVMGTDMTITPGAGTYLVFFGGDLSHNSNGATIDTCIYVNGVYAPGTRRRYARGNQALGESFSAFAKATVAAGQAIEGRWLTSGATATNNYRQLLVQKIQ